MPRHSGGSSQEHGYGVTGMALSQQRLAGSPWALLAPAPLSGAWCSFFFGCHWEEEALCWLGYNSLMLSFTAPIITPYSSSTDKTTRLSHACRLIRQTCGDNFSTTYETLGKELAFVSEKRVSPPSTPKYLPNAPVSLWHRLSQPAQGVLLGSVPRRSGMVMLRSPRHLQPPAPGPPQLCLLLAAAW